MSHPILLQYVYSIIIEIQDQLMDTHNRNRDKTKQGRKQKMKTDLPYCSELATLRLGSYVLPNTISYKSFDSILILIRLDQFVRFSLILDSIDSFRHLLLLFVLFCIMNSIYELMNGYRSKLFCQQLM